jgi:type I restriction enzyme S subunit
MKRYEAYKDSGETWLGTVPAHWLLTRLGSHFLERREKVSDKDFAPLSVTKQGILPQLDSAAKTNDGDNRKLVRKGDFVINSRSDRKGSSGISYQDGSVSLINIILKPISIHPAYCNYLLKSNGFIEEYYRIGHGIVADLWTTRYDEMKNIKIAIPPLPEQTTIAAFLDRKTALIDKAIAIKQKQIELLKERRQILIQRAVTRGLDPNTKMKDSGVEWIGEIPEGWEVVKMRNILKPVSKKNYPDMPLLSITRELGVIERNVDDLEENHNFIPEDLSGYKLLQEGQFGMNKMKAWQGSYGVSNFTGIVSPAYFVFDLINDVLPKFFHIGIRSKLYVSFFAKSSDGVRIGQWDLSKERMKEIPFCIPPLAEQQAIIAYIDKLYDKYTLLIIAKEKEIEKITEYKSTLINEVVTGKVKVC